MILKHDLPRCKFDEVIKKVEELRDAMSQYPDLDASVDLSNIYIDQLNIVISDRIEYPSWWLNEPNVAILDYYRK